MDLRGHRFDKKPLPTILSVSNLPDLATTSSGSENSGSEASGSFAPALYFEGKPYTSEEYCSEDHSQWEVASNFSRLTSGWQYAEPSQCLIFLDWDDTLFPTTDLLDRWCVPLWQWDMHPDYPLTLPNGLKPLLESWQEAVAQYLQAACAHSDRCVIVTNASRPWVDQCIVRFVPKLREIFDRNSRTLQVVYANEALLDAERRQREASRHVGCGSCFSGLAKLFIDPFDDDEYECFTPTARIARLTDAKHAAMKREADAFYSRYPGQTWKNIVSVGDMRYEYDAVHELTASRRLAPLRERLRTKAIVVPGSPAVGQLALQLRASLRLLPALICFDGPVQLDLGEAEDPLEALGQALGLPELRDLDFPRYAWGHDEEPPGPEAAAAALEELEALVAEALACGYESETWQPGGGRCRGLKLSPRA